MDWEGLWGTWKHSVSRSYMDKNSSSCTLSISTLYHMLNETLESFPFKTEENNFLSALFQQNLKNATFIYFILLLTDI